MPFTSKHLSVCNHILGDTVKSFGDIVSKQLFALIRSRTVYTVSITGMCRNIRYETIQDIFKNIPARFGKTVSRSYYEAVIGEHSHFYIDMIKYRGTPIFLVVDERSEAILLHTVKTTKNMKNMDRFVKYLYKRGERTEIGYHAGDYATLRGYRLDFYQNGHVRSFDDVFVPKSIETDICNSISCFLKNKSFYRQHHIPYHLGIMLFGEPGTGKTSIISAISNRFSIIPYYVKASDVWRLIDDDTDIHEMMSQTGTIKMIVIEDIDTCGIVQRKLTEEEKLKRDVLKKVSDMVDTDVPDNVSQSLSDFLNLIDGCGCLENVIWIFTTNNIESIDSALLRSGRTDHKFYIGYATDETFDEFLKYHYHRPLPDNCHVKNNVSFAAVQNDIMIGKSFEDILNKYTERDSK